MPINIEELEGKFADFMIKTSDESKCETVQEIGDFGFIWLISGMLFLNASIGTENMHLVLAHCNKYIAEEPVVPIPGEEEDGSQTPVSKLH